MDHKLSVKYNPMKIVDNNVGKGNVSVTFGKRFVRRQII